MTCQNPDLAFVHGPDFDGPGFDGVRDRVWVRVRVDNNGPDFDGPVFDGVRVRVR